MRRALAIIGLAVALAACDAGTDTPTDATPEPAATLTPTVVPTPIPTFAGRPLGLLATLEGDGRFHTLVTLIEAVSFAETLDDEGAFTLFAPNDAAFEALPAGSVETLLLPENAQQTADLLRYHLVHEVLNARALSELEGADSTFPGHRLLFRKRGDEVLVNNVRILIGDIHASNGVIHMIEFVLQPTSEDP